ncbi:hypothetical protein STEG23_001550, partial [Scotinomys teguina]
ARVILWLSFPRIWDHRSVSSYLDQVAFEFQIFLRNLLNNASLCERAIFAYSSAEGHFTV